MGKPKIRFKGYADDWEQRKVGDITKELSEYAKLNSGLPLLTSARTGLMYQSDYRGNSTTDNENTLFSIVPLNACTYRHMSDDSTFHINVNTLEKGLVSKEYPVFVENESDLRFVVQYINSSDSFTKFCTEQKKGGTRTRLYYKTLCEYKMLIPSLNEQHIIADYFDNLDYLITLHQRKCDETKKLKKYMLQKMFPQNGEKVPKIRFAGFSDDWEQRKLDDVVEFLDTMRKPLEGVKRVYGPYPYYGASGIVDYVDGYLFDEELILLSEDGANITDRNYPICFLATGKYWVNNHAHVLRTKQGNENNFICNSLERKDYTQYNTGMAMPKLNKETCKKIPILCPVFEEQKKIGDYFRGLDHLITLHQQKCDELQNIKKFMLKNMFA